MSEYFVACENDVEFPVIGYYVGLFLTHFSIKQGTEFERFISMPLKEIIDLWLKQIEVLKSINR